MATTLAATGSIANVPLRIAMIARLPPSDTVPFSRWNLNSLAATAAGDPLGRSRHVQRWCQTKLCSTAISTAIAVATR